MRNLPRQNLMPFTKVSGGGGVVITGDSISLYRLLTLKYRLKLEIAGMKFKGHSTYSIIKREFNWTGSKEKILARLTAHIDNMAIEQAKENEKNEASEKGKDVATGNRLVDGEANVAPAKKRASKGASRVPPAGGTGEGDR